MENLREWSRTLRHRGLRQFHELAAEQTRREIGLTGNVCPVELVLVREWSKPGSYRGLGPF